MFLYPISLAQGQLLILMSGTVSKQKHDYAKQSLIRGRRPTPDDTFIRHLHVYCTGLL